MITISYQKRVRNGEQEVDENINIEGIIPSEVEKFVKILRNTPDYNGAYVTLPVIENEQVVQHNIPVVFPNL